MQHDFITQRVPLLAGDTKVVAFRAGVQVLSAGELQDSVLFIHGARRCFGLLQVLDVGSSSQAVLLVRPL